MWGKHTPFDRCIILNVFQHIFPYIYLGIWLNGKAFRVHVFFCLFGFNLYWVIECIHLCTAGLVSNEIDGSLDVWLIGCPYHRQNTLAECVKMIIG